jgi:hypothetical protein
MKIYNLFSKGVIIQIDKTVKRIVAMFDMKNVAKLKNEVSSKVFHNLKN